MRIVVLLRAHRCLPPKYSIVVVKDKIALTNEELAAALHDTFHAILIFFSLLIVSIFAKKGWATFAPIQARIT